MGHLPCDWSILFDFECKRVQNVHIKKISSIIFKIGSCDIDTL
jgi:hypothetical protein